MTKLGTKTDHPVADLSAYNRSMSAVLDKIFFLDKVEADVFIDFGCADGFLIETMQKFYPNKTYIGYDINPEMLKAAAKRLGSKETWGAETVSIRIGKNIKITKDWAEVMIAVRRIQDEGLRVCVILSSVIHEIYSYGPAKVEEFWNQLWSLNADFIAIRDMSVSSTTSRPSDPITVARIRQTYNREMLAQWETQWGSLEENWSLVHFLLHYRYTTNWERELRENYLPINKERLLALVPVNYFPHFIEHFTLPFIRQKVMDDFGIQLQDATHLKLILRRMK